MIPSLRPVLPLFDFTAPRCVSNIRLQPRHVFRVQRFLSYGRNSFPRGWHFPRKIVPYWSKIWWITRRVPILPIRLIFLIPLCLYRSLRSWNLPVVNEGVVIDSLAGRLLYEFRSGCVPLLSNVVKPWGGISVNEGPSMQPTISGRPALLYASHAYSTKRDVRRGDVVILEHPDREIALCKRVAALEGERIRVARYGPLLKLSNGIVNVRFFHIITLLNSVFTYCRYRYLSDTVSWLGTILHALLTRGHSARCRLNPFWLKYDGDGA